MPVLAKLALVVAAASSGIYAAEHASGSDILVAMGPFLNTALLGVLFYVTRRRNHDVKKTIRETADQARTEIPAATAVHLSGQIETLRRLIQLQERMDAIEGGRRRNDP